MRGHRVTKTGILFSIAGLSALQVQAAQASGRVDEAATRVARDCPAVTREALSGVDLKKLAFEGRIAAEVWIGGEFIPDLRISIWDAGNEIRAEVAQTSQEGVCAQLRRIYRSEPGLTPEEATRRISTRVATFSEPTISELAPLLRELDNLNIRADLSDSIFMPNRRIALRVTNGLEEVSVRFNQPEPSAEGVAYSGLLMISQAQVAQWVDRLTNALGLSSVLDRHERSSP